LPFTTVSNTGVVAPGLLETTTGVVVVVVVLVVVVAVVVVVEVTAGLWMLTSWWCWAVPELTVMATTILAHSEPSVRNIRGCERQGA